MKDLPEDSLFKKDYLKVLDLLYRKYKAYVEDIDPKVIGGSIWIDKSDLNSYTLRLDRCFEILRTMDKSGVIIFNPEIKEDFINKLNNNHELFEIGMTTDFGNKYILECAQLNTNIKNHNIIEESKNKLEKKGQEIAQLDLLEDKDEIKEISIYINIAYNYPKHYNRKGSWKKMYELARDQEINFDKGFFDYFNSNKKNPLYAKEGFKMTKILRKKDSVIIPNIKINLITQKKVSQRLNSA